MERLKDHLKLDSGAFSVPSFQGLSPDEKKAWQAARNGDWETAKALAQSQQPLKSQQATHWQYLLLLLAYQQQDWPTVVQHCQAINPHDLEPEQQGRVLLFWGHAYFCAQQWAPAQKFYRLVSYYQTPQGLDYWLCYGICAFKLGTLNLAQRLLKKAATQYPDSLLATLYLARVLKQRFHFFEASQVLGKQMPDHGLEPALYHPYLYALLFSGQKSRFSQTLDMLLKNLAAQDKERAYLECQALFYSFSCYETSDHDLTQQLQIWHQTYAPSNLKTISPSRLLPPHSPGKIRLGYFSWEFNRNSTFQIMEPFLAHHDHQAFEVHALSDTVNPEPHIPDYFDVWHDCQTLSNSELAEKIQALNLDILIDLASFTRAQRLSLFNQRLAPIQVAGLGFAFPNGAREMDYFLTDTWLTPSDGDSAHRESPLYLPCFFRWQPPVTLQPLLTSPAQKQGFITFGNAGSLFKLTPEVLDCWGNLLNALPHARLALKTPALDDLQSQTFIRQRLKQHGIVPDRIQLWGSERKHNHHAFFYNQIDIALDTFPYTGGITLCDALWMGVPVISLWEPHFQSRALGLSILKALDKENWIAASRAEYVSQALRLAQDIQTSGFDRQALRQQFLESPICQGVTWTRDLESNYRHVWNKLK